METRPKPLGLAIAWAVTWIAVALATVSVVGPWTTIYAATRCEVQEQTRFVVAVGESLRGPGGWFALAPCLALGLLPLRLGVTGASYRRWLVLGIAQAAIVGMLVWASLELPLAVRQILVRGSLDLRGRAATSALFVAPGMVALAFLQLTSWVALSREVYRLPRAWTGEEALRALVLAAAPAFGAAIAAFLFVVATRATASTSLLVSPPVAAAGTAMLVVYGVALWLRLRLQQAAEA